MGKNKQEVKYLEDIKIKYDNYFTGENTIDYVVRYPYLSLKKKIND